MTTKQRPLHEIIKEAAEIIEGLEGKSYTVDDMLQVATQLMMMVDMKMKTDARIKFQNEAMARVLKMAKHGKYATGGVVKNPKSVLGVDLSKVDLGEGKVN